MLLGAVFALGVRSAAWAEGRLLVSLLVVGAAVAVQAQAVLTGPRADLAALWRDLGILYFGQLAAVGALYWAAVRLEDGQRVGLWVTGLVGLVSPQPGLLLALAGAALARYAPDDRLKRRGTVRNPRMWGALGLGLLLGLALAWMLPRPVSPAATPTAPTQAAPAPTGSPVTPPARPISPPAERPPAATPAAGNSLIERLPLFPQELMLVTLLVVALALSLGVWRARFRRGQPPKLVELLMAAALLLTFALMLVLSLGMGGEGRPLPMPGDAPASRAGAGGAGELGSPSRSAALLAAYLNALMWLGFAFYLALALLLLWFWFKEGAEDETSPPLPPAQALADPAPPPPLHRVRLAYREAQGLLAAAGRGRTPAETPLGYAARLSGHDPPLAGPLAVLTRAYQPVRYGGRVTEEDAEEAEGAVRELRDTLSQLPPPEPPQGDIPAPAQSQPASKKDHT